MDRMLLQPMNTCMIKLPSVIPARFDGRKFIVRGKIVPRGPSKAEGFEERR